jgi:phosphoribosylaminoimidazole-succinocarboxamide synthase
MSDTLSPDVVTRLELTGLPHVRSGKVREVYDAGEHLLFVATDRISAFDCILPTGIPWKGHVLNQLSDWWFKHLDKVTPNHLVSSAVADFPAAVRHQAHLLQGRSMLVRKTKVVPIECVARGYLVGSGWKEYLSSGRVAGQTLRPGYRMADRLDAPLFTPARKAETGHDENISFEQMTAEVGGGLATRLRDLTLELYTRAAEHALRCGIILADTKFEFGLDEKQSIILIDEVLTPDSSRYWPADRYQPGGSPPSFDKQFVRDYLETLAWNKQPPAPPLPAPVVAHTSAAYREAFHRLTGADLKV